MNSVRVSLYNQWDRQVNQPVLDHIELSNTYLQVERGNVILTITIANRLRTLLQAIYPLRDRSNDFIIKYWSDEFRKLPNWNNC